MGDSRRLQFIYDNRFDDDDRPYRHREDVYGTNSLEQNRRHGLSSSSRGSLNSGASVEKKFFRHPTGGSLVSISSGKYGVYNDRDVDYIPKNDYDRYVAESPGHKYNISSKTYDEIPAYRLNNLPPPLPKPRKKNRPDSDGRRCGIGILVIMTLLLIGGGLTYLILYSTGNLDSNNETPVRTDTNPGKQDGTAPNVDSVLSCPSTYVMDAATFSRFECTFKSNNTASTSTIQTEVYFRRDPNSLIEERIFNISFLGNSSINEARDQKRALELLILEDMTIVVAFSLLTACTDRGIYRVVVSVDGDGKEASINLKINASPTVKIHGPNIGVPESTSLILSCDVNSGCHPNVMDWFYKPDTGESYLPVKSGISPPLNYVTETGEYQAKTNLTLNSPLANSTLYVCGIPTHDRFHFDHYTLILLPDNICQDKDDGDYPHPFLCRLYVTCSFGHEPKVMDCGKDLMYNADVGICDHGFNVNCSDTLIVDKEVKYP